MAEDIVINGVTYPGVDSIALLTADGRTIIFGSVKTVNGIAPDANGNVDVGVSEAEKAEIVQMVIESLGGVTARVSNNRIILSGDLPDATYTAYYVVNGELVEIGDLTFGSVTPDPVTYTIRWVNYGGEVLKTVTVAEGDSEPEYDGPIPTRAEDGQYTYTFKGWDKTVDDATGDVTYTATYTQTAKPAEPAGPTNYAKPSDTLWQVNNRLATSYGNGKTDGGTGHILTNFVPAKLNDEIYVTGLDLKAYADGKPAAVGIYTNNTDPRTDYQKKYVLTAYNGTANVDGAGDKVTATTANGVTTYVYKILEKNNGTNLADSDTAYIRIDGIAIEGVADSDIVINVKRDGEWL